MPTADRLVSTTCAYCGAEISYAGRGKHPRYCRRSCRQRAYEQRRAAAAVGVVPEPWPPVRQVVERVVEPRHPHTATGWIAALDELAAQLQHGDLATQSWNYPLLRRAAEGVLQQLAAPPTTARRTVPQPRRPAPTRPVRTPAAARIGQHLEAAGGTTLTSIDRGSRPAAGFARAGMRAVTIGNHQRSATLREFVAHVDVLVVSTDSRHAPPEPASQRITELIEAVWPVDLVCNRVDTTLRGHLGASTGAMLETVGRLSGRRAVAWCAPAHPAAGRQTVDGIQLLHGRRLERTELAHDPLNPMRTSDVTELVAGQVGLHAGKVSLRDVTGDQGDLVAHIRDLVPRVDVLVVDAISEEHLSRAAEAAAQASTEVAWVAVDPGPGSVALATALRLDRRPRPPVLVVSGSATNLARRQVQRLIDEQQATVVRAALGPGTGAVNVARLVAEMRDAFDRSAELVVVATAIDNTDVGGLAPADAVRLPHDLATAVREAIRDRQLAGLCCGGGDLAAALLAAMGATGIEVEQEVVPLAVAGVVVGGRWDAVPVVTKGGLVGDSATLVACVAHLRQRAEASRRSVPVGTGTTTHQAVNRHAGNRKEPA